MIRPKRAMIVTWIIRWCTTRLMPHLPGDWMKIGVKRLHVTVSVNGFPLRTIVAELGFSE